MAKAVRALFAPILVALLSGCGARAPEQIDIFRDQYGTPHIVADSNYGVFYGYGYVVGSDRLYQMEVLKRTVTGRVAEVLGRDFVSLDTHIRTRYDLPAVRRQMKSLPAGDYEILQAYADGINHRIEEALDNPEQLLPLEFTKNDYLPEKWTAYDVAMTFIGAIAHRYSDFNSELDNLALLQSLIATKGETQGWQAFQASKWLLETESPTTVQTEPTARPPTPSVMPDYIRKMVSIASAITPRVSLHLSGRYRGITTDPKTHEAFIRRLAKHGFTSSPEFASASNLWAVNQGLAKDEVRGIFINGPQFGFSTPSYVYGIGLHGGDFKVVGNTLLGLPSLLFAHNGHTAWGSTAGLSDQVDVYVEQLDPDNAEAYLHNGKYRDFQSWNETIQIRGEPAIEVRARRSVHGMVELHDADKGLAYARARAWEGHELSTLMAWIHLAKDRSMEAVRTRLRDVATNINFYYMDKNGALGYVHAGRYPIRVQDSRLPAPGTGQWDWVGFRPYSDNPQMENPASGYLFNWNNRPHPDWISSDLWTSTWGRADRVRLLMDHLEKRPDSLKALWGINRIISFQDVSAPFLLPYLTQALQKARLTPVQRQAAQTLLSWNRNWRADAQHEYGPAASLMETWLAELLKRVFTDDIEERLHGLYLATNTPVHALGPAINLGPGVKILIRNLDFLNRGQTPDYDFFNGQRYDRVLADAFRAACKQLIAAQGRAVNSWRLPAHPMQWRPYNFRGVPQADESALVSHPSYMNRGSENNIFIATGEGFIGYDVIPPGQSGFTHPQGEKARHSTDQMHLYVNYQYKPVLFSEEEIKASAKSHISLVTKNR